jgi:hypothetical protein
MTATSSPSATATAGDRQVSTWHRFRANEGGCSSLDAAPVWADPRARRATRVAPLIEAGTVRAKGMRSIGQRRWPNLRTTGSPTVNTSRE